MRRVRRIGAVVAAVLSMTVAVGCSSGTAKRAAPSSTERVEAVPSSSPSLTTGLPAAPGTTFLATVTGNGGRSFGPVPAGGNVNLVVACVGAELDIRREPDISLVLTCDGHPYNVGLQKTAKNDEPLTVIAADTVSWAITASTAG